jgi:hypothetical protein
MSLLYFVMFVVCRNLLYCDASRIQVFLCFTVKIILVQCLTTHYTTFRKTHYKKIKLLEYIAKTVKLLEYTVRQDQTFGICHREVRAPIDSLFQTSL